MLLLLALLGPGLTSAFSEYNHRFSISEGSPPGSFIGNVPLTQGVDYRISGVPDEIEFDQKNGDIRLKDTVDRENTQSLSFSLVSNHPPSIGHVYLDVEDVNDNSPVFPLSFQNVSVLETAPVGTKLPLLAARDPDRGENGTISKYELIGDSVFRLVRDEDDVIFLELEEPLDREKHHLYSFNLTATDGGGRTGWTSVYVQVLDVNDCSPKFDQKELEANWNGQAETPVLKLNASDEDEGENAKIHYELLDSSPFFEIREDQIFSKVDSPSCCSSPPCSKCSLVVRAIDGGHPSLSTTAEVRIYFHGDNQHDPVIHIKLQPSNVDFAVIDENDEIGKAVAVLSVTDEDGPFGESASLRISRNDDNLFHLDTKLNPALSILRLAKNSSDFNCKNDLTLLFEASDGQNPPRSSKKELKVYLGNGGSTLKPSVHLTSRIAEDSPIGSFVLQIGANCSECSFSMKNSSGLPVEIDSVNGIVLTTSELSGPGQYFLDINVLPPPPSIRPSLVSVEVSVEDVNNHAPRLQMPSKVEVSELAEYGTEICEFEVIDEDLKDNAKVTISVIERSDCVKVSYSKLILICKLDYDSWKSINIVLEVLDRGKPPLSTLQSLQIVVKDENNHFPLFECGETHLALSTLTPEGTEITRIQASDADSGDFGRLHYSLLDPTSDFTINSEDGTVFTAGKLEEKTYVLRLRAIDGGGLVSSNNATLYIHFTSKPLPYFDPIQEEININQNTRYGEPLIHLSGNGTVFRTHSSLLNVTPTGDVSLTSLATESFQAAVLLEHENISVSKCLRFIVKNPLSPPKFHKNPLKLKISSSTPLGSPLIRLSPCKAPSVCSYITDCPSLFVKESGVLLLSRLVSSVDHIKCNIVAKDSLGREDKLSVEIDISHDSESEFRLREHNEFIVDPDLHLGTVIGKLPYSKSFEYRALDVTSIGVFPDGVIYVRRKLEAMDVISFRVKAKHRRLGNEHSAKVWVRVTENKVFEPICPKITMFTAMENNGAGAVIGNIDHSLRSKLRQLDGFRSLHVTPLGKVIALHSFDAETTRNVSFRVEFSSGAKKLTCAFTIVISDENEFPPVFEKRFYSVKLLPTKSIGVIGTVKARDKDRDGNGISYHLESHHRYFKLNRTTGELSTKDSLPNWDFFNVSISASDGELETRTFFIVRMDHQEEKEVVFKEISPIRISYSTPVGSIIGRSLATSGDRTVKVRTDDSRFSVDSFGWIRLLARPSSLPKELDLKLSSNGSSIVRKVYISDAEKVKENEAPVTLQTLEIGSELVLVDPPSDSFSISGGNLVVTKPLDREEQEKYRIVVENQGKYSVINVEVQDSPDHPPVCGSNTFLIGNLPAVVHLSCWDPDLHSHLRYSLKKPKQQGISIKYDGTITIDHLDDVVTVLEVDVMDRLSKQVSTNVFLVRDKTDESISFPSPSFNLLLSSSLEKDRSFGRVSAESDSRLEYFLIGSDSIGVNRETGELVVKNRTDIRLNPSNRDVILIAASRIGISTVQIRVEIVEDSLFLPRNLILLTPESISSGSPLGAVDIGRNEVALENSDERFSLKGRQLYLRNATITDNGKLISLDLKARKGRISCNIKTYILLPQMDDELIFSIPENLPRESIVGAVPEGESYEIVGNMPLKLDSDGILRTTEVLDREKVSELLFALKPSFGQPIRAKLIILDENDNKPFLEENLLKIEVSEDTKVGSALKRIRWNDSDSDDVFVWKIVEGNDFAQFSIDRNGLLILESPLDREQVAEHRLKAVLADGIAPFQYHTTSCEIIISVRDVNDNAPVMTSPSSFTVVENSSPGTTIGAVTATDRDTSSRISFRIVPESLPFAEFTIDPIFGYVQINGEIDYERKNNYTFVVEISDGELTTTEEITVIVLDVNDENPKLKPINGNLTVSETAPVGQSIARLLVEDDDGNDNRICEFWLEGGKGVIEISTWSGILYVAEKLDFEQEQQYNCTVFARNIAGGEVTSMNVTISVEDRNDEAPRFHRGSPQTIEVYENIPGPFPIILGNSVSDDEDKDDIVAYSLLSGNSSLFGVDSRNGDILLLGVLDREEQEEHQLTVLATDSGRPRMTATAQITIKVLDDNDNDPDFGQPYFKSSIVENSKIGTSVLTVMAEDRDLGPNSELTYSIATENVPFSINSTSGEITISSGIDREAQDLWEFEVVATDCGRFDRKSTKISVILEVEDENDNAPVIRNRQMDVFIDGRIPKRQIVHVVDVWDADGDFVSLTLSGHDAKFFEVLRDGRIVSAVETLLTKSFYSVTASADDGRGKSTTSTFTFYVDDAVFPKFNKIDPFVIPENALQVVVTVNATSTKPSPKDRIQYSILAGNDGSFEIGPLNGVLRIKKPLDRERQDFYRIWVMATDSDLPPKSSIQSVEVRIADQNDNKPSFRQAVYRVSVKENDDPQELVTVSATDKDIGRNAVISYSISNGNPDSLFTIDSRGTVRTTGPLDREAVSIHKLEITAMDGGTSPLKNTVLVIVNVEDEDDNSPRFTRLFHTEVYEDLPIGSEVVLVSATDPDAHGNHSFFLEDDDGTFSIDQFSGMIKLKRELDREKIPSYRLRVRLEDGVWTIFTSAQITVLDVNDNPPMFDQKNYIFSVTNMAKFNGFVVARDPDEEENGKVYYSLKEDHPNVAINSISGKMELLGTPIKNVVKLVIVARDGGIPSKFSEAAVWILLNPTILPTATIYVPKSSMVGTKVWKIENKGETFISSPFFNISQDGFILLSSPLDHIGGTAGQMVFIKEMNSTAQPIQIRLLEDSAPHFISKIFHYTILESVAVGSEIGAVSINTTLWASYFSSLTSPVNITSSGKLVLVSKLDYEEETRYVMNITVQDLQGRKDTAQVVIDVVDVDDQPPIFEKEPFWNSVMTSDNDTICIFTLDEDTNSDVDYTSSEGNIDENGCVSFNGALPARLEITARSGDFVQTTVGNIFDVRKIFRRHKQDSKTVSLSVDSSTLPGTQLYQLEESNCTFVTQETPDGICISNASIVVCGTVRTGFFAAKINCGTTQKQIDFTVLTEPPKEEQLVSRVRESPSPQKIMRLPPAEHSRYYVDDQELKKLFSISDDGVLSAVNGLDREAQAWYRIPVKTSDRRRFDVRIIVDDVVDSPSPDNKDVSVVVVGTLVSKVNGSVHPASQDSTNSFICQRMTAENIEVSQNCLLHLSETPKSDYSVSTAARQNEKSFAFNIRLSNLILPNEVKSSLNLNIFSTENAVAEFLTGLQSDIPDLKFIPLAVSTRSIFYHSIVLMAFDRNQHQVSQQELKSVIDSFLRKRPVVEVLPSNQLKCNEGTPHTEIVTTGRHNSFRGTATLWIIPEGKMEARCGMKKPAKCPPNCVLEKGGCKCNILNIRQACTKENCPNGVCIENNGVSYCHVEKEQNNCGDPSAVSLSEGHIELTPRHDHFNRSECNDTWISIDFRMNSDGALISFYYSDGLSSVVEISRGSPVFRISDGYRTPAEIQLTSTITDGKWHTLLLRMTDGGKRMIVEVDGVGREAKSRMALPLLLSNKLQKIILGSNGKQGFSGCVRKLFINDKAQDLHSTSSKNPDDASLFIASTVGRVSWGSEDQTPIWRSSGAIIAVVSLFAIFALLAVIYCTTRAYFNWRNGKGPAWQTTEDIDAIPIPHFGPKSTFSSTESHIYAEADRIPPPRQNTAFERAPTQRIRTVGEVPLSIPRLPQKTHPYYRNEAFVRVTPPPGDLF